MSADAMPIVRKPLFTTDDDVATFSDAPVARVLLVMLFALLKATTAHSVENLPSGRLRGAHRSHYRRGCSSHSLKATRFHRSDWLRICRSCIEKQ